jgi:hypothetical protein
MSSPMMNWLRSEVRLMFDSGVPVSVWASTSLTTLSVAAVSALVFYKQRENKTTPARRNTA